jgi:integrase|tara:strand:- start:412 stop:1938 length:1527 start_codon:yes stop_codon:yes gene_type:complete
MSTQKRGRVYYSRLRVPTNLISIIQKREIVKSLKTSSYSEAITRSCILEGLIVKLFSALTLKWVTMTPKQINQLIQRYTQQTIEEYEGHRLNSTLEVCGDQLEAISGVIVDKLEENCFQLLNNDFSKVSDKADSLLSEKNIQLDKKSNEYRKLCRELLIADQHIWKTELKRMDGDYSDRFSWVEASSEPEESSTELLSKIIQVYLDEHKGIWKTRSFSQSQGSLKNFLESVSDKPIGNIEKEHLRDYKKWLSKHSNGRGEKLSPSSINTHLAYVIALFNWAKNQGYCKGDNPASGLKVRKSRSADEERSAFTGEDLKVIFSDDYISIKKKRPDRFFIPLILLYTGARVGEIAQLGIDDIKEESGICCFDIHPTENTSVKTESSIRLVPVHSYLISIGFLEYYEEIKKGGHERLFPLLRDSVNGYGSAISSWFNKRLRKKGIDDKKKVLHSLRHTFITRLKSLDAQSHTISELVGHMVDSMTVGRYGKKLDVVNLKKAVEKLNFDLNLS